jgi:hypothetical protein
LFAAVIIGPQAFIKAPHFDDFLLVRPLAAQLTANYTYTVIADGTSCSSLGAPVLNDAGEAAFRVGCGSSTFVRRGDGSGPLTDIYSFTSGAGFLVPNSIISINDQGASHSQARPPCSRFVTPSSSAMAVR